MESPPALVPADDRGLQYGDGVFETILLRDGKPRFLEAHLERLQRGLDRLDIPFPAAGELQAEIARAAVQAPPRAILKVVVTRGSTRRRGYAPAGFVQARRIVSLWETAPLDFAPDKGRRTAHRTATPARALGPWRASSISTGWRMCSPRPRTPPRHASTP
jgi:4-amino-4-deoxychorismate lyase